MLKPIYHIQTARMPTPETIFYYQTLLRAFRTFPSLVIVTIICRDSAIFCDCVK